MDGWTKPAPDCRNFVILLPCSVNKLKKESTHTRIHLHTNPHCSYSVREPIICACKKKGKNAHLERHFCSDPKNKPTGWLQKRRKHGAGESVVKWANSISTTSAFMLLAGCRKWNVLNLRPFLGTHAGTMVKLIHEVPTRTFLGVQECSQWLTNRP